MQARSPTKPAATAIKHLAIIDMSSDRKIALATEGFTPDMRRYEALLMMRTDNNSRSELSVSKENALTMCDYIISMKREVNPR
jgi:hypothetical protein